MDDTFHTQHIEPVKTIRLREDERSRLRANILEHAEKNPLLGELGTQRILSPFTFWSWEGTLIGTRVSYTLALALITLLAGGGTVSASERALPGDLLYAIKVHVSEPLQGAFNFTAGEQAAWESEKAERRLEEAETLATLGQLTPNTREELEKRVAENLHAFARFTHVLVDTTPAENNDAAYAHVKLTATINAHSKILERVQDHTKQEQKVEVKRLELDVRQKADGIHSTSRVQLSTEPFDEKEKKVSTLIEKTRKSFEVENKTPQPKLSEEILVDTHSTLLNAEQALIEAHIIRTEGDPENAYSSLLNSERAAEEAAISLEQVAKRGKKLTGRED